MCWREFTSNMQLRRVSKTNREGPNTSVVHCVCVSVCVSVFEMWNFCFWALWCNYVFSLMPPNLFFIIIMLFSNEHSLVFWIKKNIQFHTMEYLVVLCVLGWVCSPLLGGANTVYFVCVCMCMWMCVCVCLWVCVWGTRHSGGLRPQMGWFLLSSLNYLAHGGICEWTLTRTITVDHRVVVSCYVFHTAYRHTYLSSVAFSESLFMKKRGCTDVSFIKRTLSSAIDRKLIWPLFALFNPVISFCEFDRRNKQANRKKKKEWGRSTWMCDLFW